MHLQDPCKDCLGILNTGKHNVSYDVGGFSIISAGSGGQLRIDRCYCKFATSGDQESFAKEAQPPSSRPQMLVWRLVAPSACITPDFAGDPAGRARNERVADSLCKF